jgi:hypothetical protein
MKLAFAANISGLVNAVTDRINEEFLKNSKKYHSNKEEEELNTLRMMKKLRKEIRKKKEKHERRDKKSRREKRKKEKQLRQLNKIIEAQKNGLELESEQMRIIEDKLYKLKTEEKEKPKIKFFDLDKNNKSGSSDTDDKIDDSEG